MARLSQGILGGISGKIGNLVGSSWKGIPVIKTKPLSVANPRTAPQQAQRGRMTNVVAFTKPILTTVVKPLWDRNAQGQSGYNAFVSENIALFDSALPSPASDLVMSTGKMAATAISSATRNTLPKTVTVNWVDDSGSGFKLGDDDVYCMVFNETTGEQAVSSGVVTRADESVTVQFEGSVSSPAVLNAYLAFRRADGTVIGTNSFAIVSA